MVDCHNLQHIATLSAAAGFLQSRSSRVLLAKRTLDSATWQHPCYQLALSAIGATCREPHPCCFAPGGTIRDDPNPVNPVHDDGMASAATNIRQAGHQASCC